MLPAKRPAVRPPDRKKTALRRLGVTPAQLVAAPDISSSLKLAKGGLTATLAALRFSTDEYAQAFLEKYDSIPDRDRKSLTWEAIALAAEVSPAALLGSAILALQRRSVDIVKIIALTNHPTITESRVKFAQLPGGFKDRDAIDTALGFLPTSKGSTFIINPQTPKSEGGEVNEQDEEAPESDLEYLFPSLSKTQNMLVPLRARSLESGS